MNESGPGQSAFSLIEVVATLLIVTAGLIAVMGMAKLGIRWSGEAIAAATGMATAQAVMVDAQPGGRTADPADGDGDGWRLTAGSLPIPASGSYALTTEGVINGYYVRRVETSGAADVLNQRQRMVSVTVDVFWGQEGRYITGLKQRHVRRH